MGMMMRAMLTSMRLPSTIPGLFSLQTTASRSAPCQQQWGSSRLQSVNAGIRVPPNTRGTAAEHSKPTANPQSNATQLLNSKQWPLLAAVTQKQWETCQQLLGMDTPDPRYVRYAAAMYAAYEGQPQLVTALLQSAAAMPPDDGSPLNHLQPTPAALAGVKGDSSASGAAPTPSLERQALRETLWWALSQKDITTCLALIEFCPELLKDSGLQSTLRTSGNMRGTVYPVFEAYLGKGGSNQQAYYSDLLRLALIDAAVDCDHGADRLRFLVKVGADVNAGQQAFTGDSPLAAAILWKCTANMQILLDHGAFVHADPASLGSESALHLAIRHWQGSLEACKVLLSYERVQVGREELCAAVDAGQLEWLQLVLGSQGNVKADEKQRSEWLKQAMLLAVERCSSDEFNDQQYVGIIKALLAPPAHWYPLPPDLLDVAVGEVLRVIQEEDVICGGAGAAVRVLGKAGADLDVNGGALWLAAAEYDSDEFLQALVEGGADLQKHGRAALRRAQSVRFATSLLRAGVPVSGDVAYEKEVLSLAVTAGPECEDIWSMLGALDKEGVVPKDHLPSNGAADDDCNFDFGSDYDTDFGTDSELDSDFYTDIGTDSEGSDNDSLSD